MRSNFKREYNHLLGNIDHSFKEGFQNRQIDTATMERMERRLQVQYHSNGELREFSAINLQYLKKIVDLCESTHVELIVLNTPLHAFYKKNIPSKYKIEYHNLIEIHNLDLVDLSGISMENDCYKSDGDHLTIKGALITTENFKNYLEQE